MNFYRRLQTAPLTASATVRQLRIVHVCLIASAALYVQAATTVVRQAPPGPIAPGFLHILEVAAILTALIALFLQRQMAIPGRDALRANPDDQQALRKFRSGQIASAVVAESVALYGFVARMMGATAAQSWPLFAFGFLLLLLTWPRNIAGD